MARRIVLHSLSCWVERLFSFELLALVTVAFKFFCVILQLRLLLLDDEHGEEKQEGEGGDGPDDDWKDQSVHLRAKSLVSLKK